MQARTASGYFGLFSFISALVGVVFFGGCLIFWWSAGYEVGLWRWPRDFKLYSEYWRIAPLKGWSRWALAGSVLCFALAAAFLFSLPKAGWTVLK
jgi:hypothetical protein